MNILYIEDEQNIATIVTDSLQSRGFHVDHHLKWNTAVLSFKQNLPDIIILDVNLPDLDGFDIAKEIRSVDSELPVIFVTARVQTADVLNGFESGGNDYLKKPFSIEELIVRINFQLKKATQRSLQIGAFTLDTRTHQLKSASEVIALSYRESELLRLLINNKNLVVKRRDILNEFWGQDTLFSGRSLDVFISRLRSYLKNDVTVKIVNVRRVGYMLVFPPHQP